MPELEQGSDRLRDARLCPCCRSAPYGSSPIIDRYGWIWRVNFCNRCEAVYQNTPMTPEAAKDFYASGRYRALCEQVTGKPWTDANYLKEQQRNYGFRWLPKLRGYLPQGKDHRWLDYGGSTGVASAALNDGVVNMAGMWLEFAEVIVADYGDGAPHTPEQAWELGPYDAILCCQTLDHLVDPLVTLKKFHEIANKNARLFVDVVKLPHTQYKIDHPWYAPNAACFVGLVERSGWSVLWLDGETNPTHWSVLAEKA